MSDIEIDSDKKKLFIIPNTNKQLIIDNIIDNHCSIDYLLGVISDADLTILSQKTLEKIKDYLINLGNGSTPPSGVDEYVTCHYRILLEIDKRQMQNKWTNEMNIF